MADDGTYCSVCGQSKEAHETLKHQYNTNGDLIAQRPTMQTPHPQDAMTIRLAIVLHQRGIFGDEAMNWVLTGSANDSTRRCALGDDPDRTKPPAG